MQYFSCYYCLTTCPTFLHISPASMFEHLNWLLLIVRIQLKVLTLIYCSQVGQSHLTRVMFSATSFQGSSPLGTTCTHVYELPKKDNRNFMSRVLYSDIY